jgi:hypothetical protein
MSLAKKSGFGLVHANRIASTVPVPNWPSEESTQVDVLNMLFLRTKIRKFIIT